MNRPLNLSALRMAFFALSLWFFLLVGCTSMPTVTVTPLPKTDVKVQLSWVHTIEFAGLYVAAKEGYYRDENLAFEPLVGGYDDQGNYIDPVQVVLDGKASFGITGADVILTNRAEGKPLVAIAAIYQRSPVALIALGKQGVIHPADLKGKRVATEPGTSLGIAYDALLASQNIQHSDITEVPRTDFTTQPLLSGEVDVLLSFITDDAINARNFDNTTTTILMSDYGVDIYTNVIFTTEDMIKNHPDVVQSFVRATVHGLRKAIDDPEKAAQYVLDTYGGALTTDYRALQIPGMLTSLPLIKPAGSQPGMMQPEKWTRIYQILDKQGLLKHPVDVLQAYTLDFLNNAYNK